MTNAWLGSLPTDSLDWGLHLTRLLARTFLTWLSVGALLSLCVRAFSRPSTSIRWLADASYPIYLSHESIIVALGSLMLALHWPATAKFLVVAAVAFLISAGFAVAVLRTRLLRALYTGRSAPSFGAVTYGVK
jgi:peptidoglycan/LPS O-acetylase OafA/YrhL